jgi:vacuolar-type H+-ATPase subunit E/Vma4
MTITDRDSSELLCEEISANARRDSDDILSCARRDAQDLLGKAHEEAGQVRLKRLEDARLEGERRKDITRAATFVECRRLRLARIESLLESIRSEVRENMVPQDKDEYRESVINLAAGAIKNMEGKDFIVRLREEDRAVLDGGIADLIAVRAGIPGANVELSFETLQTGGGPIVSDASGREVWDNSYAARVLRLWPDLRRVVVQKVFSGGLEADEPEGGTR